ncbi:MAG: hypothetical protein V1783_01075, partial [Bacteroidota bacterium]
DDFRTFAILQLMENQAAQPSIPPTFTPQSSPPETPPILPKKSIIKPLIIALVLLFLAATGVAGYFAYQSLNSVEQIIPSPTNTSTENLAPPSPQPTIMESPTSLISVDDKIIETYANKKLSNDISPHGSITVSMILKCSYNNKNVYLLRDINMADAPEPVIEFPANKLLFTCGGLPNLQDKECKNFTDCQILWKAK